MIQSDVKATNVSINEVIKHFVTIFEVRFTVKVLTAVQGTVMTHGKKSKHVMHLHSCQCISNDKDAWRSQKTHK